MQIVLCVNGTMNLPIWRAAQLITVRFALYAVHLKHAVTIYVNPMHVGQYNSKKAIWHYLPERWASRLNSRVSLYLLLTLGLSIVLAVSLSLVYIQEKTYLETINAAAVPQLFTLFVKIYTILFLLMSVAAWWLVLNDESRRNAEIETHQQTTLLIDEIAAHEVTSKDLQDARIAAERANDAKSRYVIGISHELRTPLNSILGYSQLLPETRAAFRTRQNGARGD